MKQHKILKSYIALCFLLITLGNIIPVFAQLNITLENQISYTESVNDIWGYTAPDGTEYALVGTQTAFSIVDIDSPTPAEIHRVSGANTTWRDIKFFENYAYIVNEAPVDSGLLIVDLSFLPDSIATYKSDLGVGYTDCHNIFIDENGFAYLFGASSTDVGGGTFIADLNVNPTNPTYTGKYAANYVHDGFVRGDTLWTSEIFAGLLGVVDVSNKSNPILLNTQATPKAFAHACWLSDDGNTIYLVEEKPSSWVISYDVSDIYDIKELDRWQSFPTTNTIPHNTFVKGNYVVNSYYTSGVVILDATNPENLVEVGFYDTSLFSGSGYYGCWGVYPYLPSGRILATDRQQGLFVLNPTYMQACYIEGAITDIYSAATIANANINILNFPNSIATSDFFGTYMTGIATAGTYEVEVSAEGYHTTTVSVTVSENGTTTVLDVALEPILSCETPIDSISVVTIDFDEALIGWQNSEDAIVYHVQYREADNLSWTTTTIAENFILLENLLENVSYQIQVQADCGNGNASIYTEILNFTTTIAPCDVPENVLITNITTSTAQVNWTNINNAEEYSLQYKVIDETVWETINTTELIFILEDLAFCTDYEVQLQAKCAFSESDFTETLTFSTLSPSAAWNGTNIQQCESPLDLNTLVTGDLGGTWSGAGGASSGFFDPSTLISAAYYLTYTVGQGDCLTSETHQIIVSSNNSASWNAVDLFTCDLPLDLNTLVTGDTNGVWSGTSVSNHFFYPNIAGAGVHDITYTVGEGSCAVSETQTIIVDECSVSFGLKVFLQAADIGNNEMTNDLALNGFLPLEQPYNIAPYNYNGTENIAILPTNATDWVLVELYNASDNSILEAQQAAMLLQDGTVMSANGDLTLTFEGILPNENYYIVVRHRNHLDVMSVTAVDFNTTTMYDFTTAETQALGNMQLVETENGIFAMRAGDIDGDGFIVTSDYNLYLLEASQLNTYIHSDLTLDNTVSVQDFNFWLQNINTVGVLQIQY